MEFLEVAFAVLLFVRFYLAGLLFGVFCRTIKIKNDWAISIGAVAFAFCGFNLAAGMKHVFFLNGSIFLMLMLIAVERIFRGRGWRLYVVSAALMLVANFYFAYQTTLMIIVYILIRLLSGLRRRGIKASFKLGMKLLGGYLLGAMLVGVILAPVFRAFLQSARSAVESGYTASMLRYPLQYYLQLAASFVTPDTSTDYWTYLGFTPLTGIAVLCLFVPQKKHLLTERERRMDNLLRLGVCMGIFALCVPIFGKIFNGFSYVCNRWCYGVACVMALVLVRELPEMLKNSVRMRYIALLAGAGAVVLLAGGVWRRDVPILIGGLSLGAVAVFFLICRGRQLQTKTVRRLLSVGFTLLMIGWQMNYCIPAMTPLYYTSHGLYNTILNETAAAAGQIEDDDFFRVDTGGVGDTHSSLLGYRGVGFYWSVIPGHVSSYYNDMCSSHLTKSFCLHSAGGGAALTALSSVKYAVRAEGDKTIVPYGFEQTDSVTLPAGETIEVYENRYALPIGVMFAGEMPQAQYAELAPIDKMEALLRWAVVEEAQPVKDAEFSATVLPYTITEQSGVRIFEDRIEAEAGGRIVLTFEGMPDSETYLYIDGVSMECVGTTGVAQLETVNGTNRMGIVDRTTAFYYGQKGALTALGYSETGLQEIVMTILDESTIGFKDISVLSVPVTTYRDSVARLQTGAAENITVENNRITCTITAKQAGVLQMSVPFSEGWSAWVDGEKAETFLSGGMYTGIRLTEGAHTVEMRYCTPGLKLGACVSAAAAIVFVLVSVLSCGKKRAKKPVGKHVAK